MWQIGYEAVFGMDLIIDQVEMVRTFDKTHDLETGRIEELGVSAYV